LKLLIFCQAKPLTTTQNRDMEPMQGTPKSEAPHGIRHENMRGLMTVTMVKTAKPQSLPAAAPVMVAAFSENPKTRLKNNR
jgi:hypothetical protein